MISYTNQLYEAFSKDLEQLGSCYDLHTIHAKMQTSIVYLDRLKEFIQNYSFKDTAEEILFFKKIKHKFYVPLIFYAELQFVFSNMPTGDKKVRIAYFRQVIDNCNTFIERNKVLAHYHKISRSNEDELMFLRKSDCQPLFSESNTEIDHSFCTVSSSILSKLIAFEQVNVFLGEEIEKLQYGKNIIASVPATKEEATIKWSGSKAELTELLYAVHSNGSFGDIPINKVMETFEKSLSINLGNYYRSFQDLSMRKKSRTPYLNSLITSIEKKFDESY